MDLPIEVIDFATWYSGMERSKVVKAYHRYLKEVNPMTSMSEGERQPVGNNEQGGNKCKICGHSMTGEPFQICQNCDDDEGLW